MSLAPIGHTIEGSGLRVSEGVVAQPRDERVRLVRIEHPFRAPGDDMWLSFGTGFNTTGIK